MLHCFIDDPNENGHQLFYREFGRRRYIDVAILCTVLIRFDTAAAILAIRFSAMSFS